MDNIEKDKIIENLKMEIEELKRKHNLEINNLKEQIECLKNENIDKDYENGFFIDDDVFKAVEEENHRLRTLCDEVYGNLTRVWFDNVEKKIKEK